MAQSSFHNRIAISSEKNLNLKSNRIMVLWSRDTPSAPVLPSFPPFYHLFLHSTVSVHVPRSPCVLLIALLCSQVSADN